MKTLFSYTTAISLLLLLAPAISGQSEWIDFVDETSSRLQLSVIPLDDQQEKDVAVGDLDRDGDTDLVIARKRPFSNAGKRLNVLLMNENGILVDRTETYIPDFLIKDDARDILVFDCNGDEWPDLVIATTFDDPPRLFVNQGNSPTGQFLGFTESMNWYSPDFVPGPKFCAVYDGDVDNDGDLDLFFSDYDNDLEDRLLINDGTGQFTDETEARFPTGINETVFGTGNFICDFNDDGWNDIVHSSGTQDPAKLLINEGHGYFLRAQTLPSIGIYMLRTGDFNNDDRMDIYMVSDFQDYHLVNEATNPDGTIQWTRYFVRNSPKTRFFGGNVKTADLDRDGDLDIGVADVDVDIPGCTRRFAILRNDYPDQNPLYDPNSSLTLNWNTQGVHDFAWIDINGDGFTDLFQATCGGYKIYRMVPFAKAVPFGEACAGTRGLPIITTNSDPVIGNGQFQVRLKNALPNITARLLISSSEGNRTANDCTRFVSLPLLRSIPATFTNASGATSLTFPIPDSPALEGISLFAQWMFADPNGSWLLAGRRFAASEGLEIYLSSNDV